MPEIHDSKRSNHRVLSYFLRVRWGRQSMPAGWEGLQPAQQIVARASWRVNPRAGSPGHSYLARVANPNIIAPLWTLGVSHDARGELLRRMRSTLEKKRPAGLAERQPLRRLRPPIGKDELWAPPGSHRDHRNRGVRAGAISPARS